MDDILREQLGHEGFVMSDGDAVILNLKGHLPTSDLPTVVGKGIAAGCDMNSGSSYRDAGIEAMNRGLVNASRLAQAASRSMFPRFRLGEFDPPSSLPTANITLDAIGNKEHIALAREAARRSAVLLKNDGNVLPLSLESMKRLIVAGPLADDQQATLGSYYTEPVGGFNGVSTVLKALQGEAAATAAPSSVSAEGGGPVVTYYKAGGITGT